MINTSLATEHTFFIEDAIQDKTIKNRWYFKFPDEWRTSENREPIIGIRSITIPKAYRHTEFDFKIEKYLKTELTKPYKDIEFHCESYLFIEHDLRTLRKNIFDSFAKEITKCGLESEFNKDLLYFCYEYLEYEHRKSYAQVFKIRNDDPSKYVYKFAIYNLNDDAKAVLNYYKQELTTGESPLILYDCWDRHESLIKSNLSSLNSHQYLGFSESIYRPIKYFKLHENTTDFWIELWNSRNKDVPNILPNDKKDGLIIETLLLESGKQIR